MVTGAVYPVELELTAVVVASRRASVSLAMETFVCRATRSSGSPRNSRPTIAILR